MPHISLTVAYTDILSEDLLNLTIRLRIFKADIGWVINPASIYMCPYSAILMIVSRTEQHGDCEVHVPMK